MDMEFGNFDNFNVTLENLKVKKTRKFDRMLQAGKGGSIATVPAVSDGVMYFGDSNGYIFAIDAETGNELWRFRTDGIIFGSSSFVYDGKVYTGSYDGRLYCLDKMTGEKLWAYNATDKIFSSVSGADGFIYFGTVDGNVFCLDAKTGQEIWRFKTGGLIGSCPTVWKEKLYFGSHDNNMYCLDASSGKEIWRFKTGGEIMTNREFTVWNGTLFIPSFDNFLYAVEAETGREIWRFRTGEYGNSGTVSVKNGILYHVARDGFLFALTREGKELWRYKTSAPSTWQIPQLADDGIYITSEDGFLYKIGYNGSEIFRKKVSITIIPPVIYRNRLFMAAWDCNLYCLDLDGEEIWRAASSTLEQAEFPPANDAYRVEIQKTAEESESIASDDRYSGLSETLNLSDYGAKSEYAGKSEYTHKSEYATEFVIFEGRVFPGGFTFTPTHPKHP